MFFQLYRWACPEKWKECNQRYRAKHLKKERQRVRKWWKDNHSVGLQCRRRWWRKNPHRVAQQNGKRKALLKNSLATDCSAKIIELRLARFCRWCCRPFHKNLTIDHVIPLDRGGNHIPDNLVAACLSCNTSRRNKLVEEWLPFQKLLWHLTSSPPSLEMPEMQPNRAKRKRLFARSPACINRHPHRSIILLTRKKKSVGYVSDALTS